MHSGLATSAFDDFCDQPGAAKLGKRRLQADRQKLKALTTKAVEHVNTYVAHTNRNPSLATVTYSEFEGAIEHMGKMLQRYVLLLSQDALLSPTPVIPGDPLAALRQGLR